MTQSLFEKILEQSDTEAIVSTAKEDAQTYIDDMQNSVEKDNIREANILRIAKREGKLDFGRLLTIRNQKLSLVEKIEVARNLFEEIFGTGE